MNTLEIANEVMKELNKIEYGFKDSNGENIIEKDIKKWDDEFNDFYYLLEPEELLEKKCGVCWDQVELERKLFSDHLVPVKTYFIFIKEDDMLPSHTFLTFEYLNKVYWFEHSWGSYKGIFNYSTEKELLKDVINKFRKSHPEVKSNSPLYIYEYEKPKKHIKCDEFYKYIETQKRMKID